MIKSVVYYFEIYKKYISTSFTKVMSFRTSFILVILMDLLFYFTTLLTIDFIYDHTAHIGPWNRNQFLFFVAFMLTIDHLHMM